MLFYLITTFSVIFLVVGIVILMLYAKGFRFFRSREQQETEAGLHKAFAKDAKWGVSGGAEHEFRNHSSHSDHSSHNHYSDSGSGHASGGGDSGGGGND
ncbi:MAG TPA: hypothetical protein VNN22_03780 [Verrucomicrobiae bacterium]|nr:hypothetical protein [Verrucomicrobiae bacterium]